MKKIPILVEILVPSSPSTLLCAAAAVQQLDSLLAQSFGGTHFRTWLLVLGHSSFLSSFLGFYWYLPRIWKWEEMSEKKTTKSRDQAVWRTRVSYEWTWNEIQMHTFQHSPPPTHTTAVALYLTKMQNKEGNAVTIMRSSCFWEMRPNVVSIFHCLKETKAYFQEIKETN